MTQMWVAGAWTDAASTYEVRSPYTGEVVAAVPAASAADADAAIGSRVRRDPDR